MYAGAVHFFLRKKKKKKVLPFSVLRSFSFITSRGFGWRIHCGVEVTESSTNKQHTLSLTSCELPVMWDAREASNELARLLGLGALVPDAPQRARGSVP